eukprot:IDg10986t1
MSSSCAREFRSMHCGSTGVIWTQGGELAPADARAAMSSSDKRAALCCIEETREYVLLEHFRAPRSAENEIVVDEYLRVDHRRSVGVYC